MTFFSRLRLNPTRRETRRLVSSPQAMHAAVMGSHPLGSGPEEGRVLWRLDRQAPHDLELFVVSPSRPDFTGLVEQAGWPTIDTWDTTEYDGFLRQVSVGQQWRFRLTANPVRATAVAEGRGAVRPHVTVAHQQEWLFSRADSWGFAVLTTDEGSSSVAVRDRHTAQFHRSSQTTEGERRGRVSITRADFVGRLEVVDADRLRHALVHGMGRAKACGCGLMTLARG